MGFGRFGGPHRASPTATKRSGLLQIHAVPQRPDPVPSAAMLRGF